MESWRQRNANNVHLCYRDLSADDVVTTANAVERSRLQALSVACGRVRVPEAYTNISLSVTSCEQDIDPENNSTECQQAAQLAADSGKHCCLHLSTALCCTIRFDCECINTAICSGGSTSAPPPAACSDRLQTPLTTFSTHYLSLHKSPTTRVKMLSVHGRLG